MATLSRLAAAWWDPDVLLTPNVANPRYLLREVKSRVQPGTVVFSLSLKRLTSCELYFHANDVDVVTECVCTNAQKNKWWK